MKIYKLLLLFILIFPSVSFASQFSLGAVEYVKAVAPRCQPITKSQVAALFDRWNNSLRTGDPIKVARNYAGDAVLLPTLSGKVRLTDEERIDYFKGFLKKGPMGRIDSRTIRIGCNKAIDTGTYTFSFNDGTEAPARYTFTYAWNGKEWLITTHHSSASPK